MALVGNMIASAFSGNPSIVNYDMFVAVFGMLSLLYLIPATLKEAFQFHPIIMIALDLLNTFFYLIGGIATAAYLGVHSCSNSVSTVLFISAHPRYDTTSAVAITFQEVH
jgi:hypothetical protein